MKLSDFYLLKETPESYTVGHPDGRSLQVPKTGMNDNAHGLIAKLKRVPHFDEGTPDAPIAEQADPQAQFDQDYPEPVNQTPTPGTQTMTQEGVPVNQPVPQPQATDPQTQASPDSQAPPQPATAPPTPANLAQKASDIDQNQIEAVEGGVKAAGEIGEATAEAKGQELSQLPSKTATQLMQENEAKDQKFADAYHAAPNDPDRYWHNKTTGSKVASIIGIILGGLVKPGDNMALNMLNRERDSDIEAQRNDQSKSMNLWKMNRELTKNKIQADLITANQLDTIAQAKIQQATAQQASPLAAEKAAPLIAGLQQQKFQRNVLQSLMQMRSQPGISSEDPQQLVRFIPGLQPEQQKDLAGAIEKAQQVQNTKKAVNEFFNQAVDENGRYKFNIFESPSLSNLRASMMVALRDNEGKVSDASLENMNKILPQKWDFGETPETRRTGVEAFLNQIQNAAYSKAHSYNFPLEKFQSTAPWALGQVNNKFGAQYKKVVTHGR